jgi:tetratricopeptide (TPR) repeat protein
LGQVSHQLGDTAGAETHYSGALELLAACSKGEEANPSFGERKGLAFSYRGRLFLAQNRHPEAEADLENAIAQLKSAIAHHPNPVQLSEHLAWAEEGLGDVYLETERPAQAAAQYATAMNVLSSLDSPDHLYNRARLLSTCPDSQVFNPKAACEVAAKAVEMRPENPRYAGMLGLAYLRNGQPDLAQRHLQEVIENSPKEKSHPLPLLCLVLAYQQLGHSEKAQTVLKENLPLSLMAQNVGDPLFKRLEQEIDKGFASGGP